MLRNILDMGGVLDIMPVTEHLPLLSIEQCCWWQWGSQRRGKGEGIARGDKKDNIFQDLFMEGWSTSERGNDFRETKVDLEMPPVLSRAAWFVCVRKALGGDAQVLLR